MTFRNKKEEVIEITLTQFGKDALSRGVFKPSFYQFFDDGIIYESLKGPGPEKQNDSEDRIRDSISTRSPSLVLGVETRFDQETEDIKDGKSQIFKKLKRQQNVYDQEQILKYSLGEKALGTQVTPNFVLGAKSAKIKSHTRKLEIVSEPQESSKGIVTNTPQLNFEPSYYIIIDKTEINESLPPMPEDFSIHPEHLLSGEIQFYDESTAHIVKESLYLDLEEFGVDFAKDNFEVEFYEIVDSDEDEEKEVLIRDNSKLFGWFDIITDESLPEYEDIERRRKEKLRNFY